MKIQCKPLKGETFEVEIEVEQKVQDLKQKIAELKPEYPADATKLIHSGKILTDEQEIKDMNIKPADFVVVMCTKPKAPEPTPPAVTPPTTGTTTTASYEQAAASFLTGAEAEATIERLCGMGFEREQVVNCLRASYGNPDRASEYLLNGIPEGLTNEGTGEAPTPPVVLPPPVNATGGPTRAPPSVAPANLNPSMPPTGGTTLSGGGGSTVPALAELRNLPNFPELARLISANPMALQQILPAIAQSNPGLVQAIQANPDEFMRILQEGARPDPVAVMLAAVQGQAPGATGTRARPPGSQVVRLNEEEEAAITRLTQMGFERSMAAQAYFACGKDEEAAANFLLTDSMQQD